MNFKHIIEGWRNHLVPAKEMKEPIEKVSEERLAICATCPWQSDNFKAEGKTLLRPDLHCTNCGCTLIAKTKSLASKCPIGKWEAYVTDVERYEIEQQIKNDNETHGLQTGSDQGSEGTSEDISESDTN